LELVAVKVPWVQVVVVVVDYDLDDVAVVDNEWVDLAVHRWVRCEVFANGVRRVQSGHFLRNISLVVDGEAPDTVDLSREGVDDDLLVDWLQQRFLIEWDKFDIVGKVELVQNGRGRQRLCLVINKPGSDVGVVIGGDRPVLVDEHHVDIHGIPDSKVFAGIRLRVDEDTRALTRSNTKHLVASNIGLGVHSINFDDGHLVAIQDPGVTGPVANTDDMDKVSLVGLDLDLGFGGIVDQSRVGDGLVTSKGFQVLLRFILVEQIGHFTVVPVAESNGELIIVVEWGLGVVNNKGTTESIRILTHVVRVIPVSSGLVHLYH
jgi:hypothetical protein